MKRANRHETLVNRLRRPLDDKVNQREMSEKLNAIGEALAYIIDKRHQKKTVKKLKAQVKKAKRRSTFIPRRPANDDDDWPEGFEKAAPYIALYRHSKKAVRHGCPGDRIFHVVGRFKDGELLAWKCTELDDGRIDHPAFKKPITMQKLRTLGDVSGKQTGGDPTAQFKPDSYYVAL